MKKSLLLAPIVTLAMISLTNTAINVKAAKVFKQTATVYQIKKTGKTYKITSQTKKTTDQDINVGKSVVIKGHRYYYSHVFKGYITDKAFALNAKLDEKRAKHTTSAFTSDKNKNKNTTTNSSNTDSNKTNNNAKIVNGYDENNQKIVDMNAFTTALIQTSFNKLNEFRQSQGLNTLSMDNNLMKIAKIRAQKEASDNWNSNEDAHYDNDGTPYAFQVANQLGFNNYQNGALWGENAGEYILTGLDHTTDIGNQSVQDAIDEGPTGGHYKNDVNPKFTKCGIGFYVNGNNVGYVLELQ